MWLALLVMTVMVTMTGCIRFPSDTPSHPDGATDASADDAADGGDGAEVATIAAPICDPFGPTLPEVVAADLVSGLLTDCRVQEHFKGMPPVRLTHFQECFAAQIGSVLGCVHLDGEPFKYPTYDSKGVFCRDMKSSHVTMSTSDGDFDAFIQILAGTLVRNGLTAMQATKVGMVFGAVRVDIVKLKDAGPTAPCDASTGADI